MSRHPPPDPARRRPGASHHLGGVPCPSPLRIAHAHPPARVTQSNCGPAPRYGGVDQRSSLTHSPDRLPPLTVVTGPLRVRGSILIPESELSWRFSRSSGPGGQGVNTTDSRVELRYDVARSTALNATQRERALERLAGRLVDGVLSVTASEHRSQQHNRAAARTRLASLVAAAVAPAPRARRATRPTRGSVERRIAAKKRRADVKRLRRPD